MKKYAAVILVFFALMCAGIGNPQKRVMEKYFPECGHQMIGATEGAICRHDDASREWTIQYWGNGWGDCPAGCIHKDYFGTYSVDSQGNVYEGADPKTRRKIDPSQISKWGPGNQMVQPSRGVSEDDPLGCLRHEDCFWYQCCSTRPMSRIYRQKHWQDVHMIDSRTDHCMMECEHAPVPKDQRLACIDLTCRSVAKDFPEVDPSRRAVWIGRVFAAPQCREITPGPELTPAPLVIKRAKEPEIKPGPKFSAWAGQKEKELKAGREQKFSCRACDICYHVVREYLLVFEDERDKFDRAAWKEVAP